MVGIAPSPWRLEFARKAAVSRDLEQRLRDDRLLKEKREKEEREAGAAEQDDFLAMVDLLLASDQQIDAFTVKLDALDAATVEALMQNEVELNAVRERIASMLLDAHVLPDGRRVFKTRDGTQVFDEFGAEIPADELAPEQISDDKTFWEDFLAERRSETALEQEREKLLAFQERLDDARERLEDPALTEDDLAALEDELGEAMPARATAILNREAGGPAPEPEARAAIEQVRDNLAPQNLPVPSGP